MLRRRFVALCALLVPAALLAGPSAGAPPDGGGDGAGTGGAARALLAPSPPLTLDETSDRADTLAQQADERFEEGRINEAEALYTQSWALKQSYYVAGNLGAAEMLLGKPRAAAEHFLQALKHVPSFVRPASRTRARELLAVARAQVGSLVIDVDAAGSEVFVDDKLVGTSPLADEVFVDPGERIVRASHAGLAPASITVVVDKGSRLTVHLPLLAAPKPAPPPSLPRATLSLPTVDPSVLPWIGVVLIGVLAGLGTVLGLRRVDATVVDAKGVPWARLRLPSKRRFAQQRRRFARAERRLRSLVRARAEHRRA